MFPSSFINILNICILNSYLHGCANHMWDHRPMFTLRRWGMFDLFNPYHIFFHSQFCLAFLFFFWLYFQHKYRKVHHSVEIFGSVVVDDGFRDKIYGGSDEDDAMLVQRWEEMMNLTWKRCWQFESDRWSNLRMISDMLTIWEWPSDANAPRDVKLSRKDHCIALRAGRVSLRSFSFFEKSNKIASNRKAKHFVRRKLGWKSWFQETEGGAAGGTAQSSRSRKVAKQPEIFLRIFSSQWHPDFILVNFKMLH